MSHMDLMAGPPPTHLPVDPASAELTGDASPVDVVRRHPESPLAWATLAAQAAERALRNAEREATPLRPAAQASAYASMGIVDAPTQAAPDLDAVLARRRAAG